MRTLALLFVILTAFHAPADPVGQTTSYATPLQLASFCTLEIGSKQVLIEKRCQEWAKSKPKIPLLVLNLCHLGRLAAALDRMDCASDNSNHTFNPEAVRLCAKSTFGVDTCIARIRDLHITAATIAKCDKEDMLKLNVAECLSPSEEEVPSAFGFE